ncbi:MAG: superfamily II DNA or RNA helicase [Saprospiraceae bacterium]|jgi:superfamily II DNA or RNA helicase
MEQGDFEIEKQKTGKQLYHYQEKDLEQVFDRFENCPDNYNLLYQLPTGGGKTVVFSEITRQYIKQKNKKVLILTHRIELSRQTSNMLTEFNVNNKVINSQVKDFPDQDGFMCFVAMVETLNNRLNDNIFTLEEVGLVIIDEAHYNSFRKLFKFFENCFILGVTATPLSSNIKLPMKDIYQELIVGSSIEFLIENSFLAKAITYSYDVGLSGLLKVGINGDYTVKSSEDLYNSLTMQNKLLTAYNQRGKGKKTLIFNNGINTSRQVYETFTAAGYDIRHLDNTNTKQQRKEILAWFKTKPNAILTSVSILTTGFDEPTIETIILNRATRSLSLYFQMIGRGSRVLPNKPSFDVIDMGNNLARFGLWSQAIDWPKIFRSPHYFLENIISDDQIERQFRYVMPEDLRSEFPNSESIEFDISGENEKVIADGLKTSVILDRSLEQHLKMILENSDEFPKALELLRCIDDDISDRIRQYSYCITNSTRNYREWVLQDYKKKLRTRIIQEF